MSNVAEQFSDVRRVWVHRSTSLKGKHAAARCSRALKDELAHLPLLGDDRIW
jgi:hypothetical protein